MSRAVPTQTRLVRGRPPRGGEPKAEFQQFYAYLEKLWSEVRRLKAEGKTLEQTKAALPLKERFPEAANLQDERNRGNAYETLGIHQYNVEFLWKTLEK